MRSYKEMCEKSYNIAKEHLGENNKRFIHSCGVANLAGKLAPLFNIDPYKAMCAGYMHDYAKYDDPKAYLELLTEDEIDTCNTYPFLYHAYLSCKQFGRLVASDSDIMNAIKFHVFGRPRMSDLEAIITLSDFCEENRTYPECIEARRILLEENNFNKAMVYYLESTINHVKDKGDTPHPNQIKILEEYRGKLK